MINNENNIKRYINSKTIDRFDVGDCADISFPNGYNKANRVFKQHAPSITNTTVSCLVVKVNEKYYLSEEQQKRLLERTEVDIENVDEPTCLDVYNKKLVKDTSICLTEPHHNNLRLVTHSLYPRSGDPTKGGTGHLTKEDGTSYCLDTGNNQAIEKNNKIRRLTPIECERLQGFPDNFTKGVSDTQRYKQMGNTITVNVIEALIKNLLK